MTTQACSTPVANAHPVELDASIPDRLTAKYRYESSQSLKTNARRENREEESPLEWRHDFVVSPTSIIPPKNVTWYEAVEYCNWLSARSGLTPAYSRSGT